MPKNCRWFLRDYQHQETVIIPHKSDDVDEDVGLIILKKLIMVLGRVGISKTIVKVEDFV